MQNILTRDIEVWDVTHKPITVHIGESSILWHEKFYNLGCYSCRGEIKGHCLFTDIVFCHYRHKVEEVVVIALPRKRSHRKVELRERFIQRFSFFSPPKSIITSDMLANPAYFIYKHLHHVIMNEYKADTEHIIEINKRYYDSEEAIEKLQHHLAVNPSQSILG